LGLKPIVEAAESKSLLIQEGRQDSDPVDGYAADGPTTLINDRFVD
jgi:hypothetical protein